MSAIRGARGTLYDPAVAALCDGRRARGARVAAAVGRGARARARRADAARRGRRSTRRCRAAAEFADLKSPWLLGHSTAVAELAEAAAWRLRLGEAGRRVRRAGLLHDLGRVGVPNGVWERPGPLGSADWEAVRLHPYYAERVLSRCGGARAAGRARGARTTSGSTARGYHRGAAAAQLRPRRACSPPPTPTGR